MMMEQSEIKLEAKSSDFLLESKRSKLRIQQLWTSLRSLLD